MWPHCLVGNTWTTYKTSPIRQNGRLSTAAWSRVCVTVNYKRQGIMVKPTLKNLQKMLCPRSCTHAKVNQYEDIFGSYTVVQSLYICYDLRHIFTLQLFVSACTIYNAVKTMKKAGYSVIFLSRYTTICTQVYTCTVEAALSGAETCTWWVSVTQQQIYKVHLAVTSKIYHHLCTIICAAQSRFFQCVELSVGLGGEIAYTEGLSSSIPMCQR